MPSASRASIPKPARAASASNAVQRVIALNRLTYSSPNPADQDAAAALRAALERWAGNEAVQVAPLGLTHGGKIVDTLPL